MSLSEAVKGTLPGENKMGVMPIGKLLVNISLPIVLSVLVQAAYNLVDSIYLSRIDEDALAVISIAFPMQTLMFSVASGTGVGINAMLARRLGEKRFREADAIAQNGLFVVILSWLAFVAFGLFFARAYYSFQTSDPEIVAMGGDYIRICTVFSFGLFVELTYEKFLLSTGKTALSMIAIMSSAITKIIFDPLLIFGLWGFPALGVTGAAVVTVLGQFVGMIVAVVLNTKFNKEVTVLRRGFRPSSSSIAEIYKIGIPSIVMSSVGSVMTFGMNRLLLSYTSTATAVFGAYFRLQGFLVQPLFAINNGVVSIVAYNYGAKKKDRIVKTIRLSITAAVVMLMFSFTVMQLFPDRLLSLFNASPEMLKIGITAFRVITLSYLTAGPVIILSAAFQALGRSLWSLLVSVIRQLAVLLPCAYTLSALYGLSAVWWAYPVAETVALILSIIFFRIVYLKTIKTIPGDEAALPVESEVAGAV